MPRFAVTVFWQDMAGALRAFFKTDDRDNGGGSVTGFYGPASEIRMFTVLNDATTLEKELVREFPIG